MNCFINGNISYYSYYASLSNLLIQNNIILGSIELGYRSIIRNNTIIASSRNDEFSNYACIVKTTSNSNSEIYNNIVINTNTDYHIKVNENQTVDTFFSHELTIVQEETNTTYNNILSSKPDAQHRNSVFNKSLEDVLIWNAASTTEEKYKHKANGPAVGAGVNGTTCGAYGQVNGGRAYQPAGIPQYRPFIYDAVIDDTPSSNNTINASFKIKVQQ